MARDCTIEGWGDHPQGSRQRRAGGKNRGQPRALVFTPRDFLSNLTCPYFLFSSNLVGELNMGSASPPLSRFEENSLFALMGLVLLAGVGLVLGILALAFGAI